jgi:hypothetical protein
MEAFGIVLPVEYLVESNPVRPRKESLAATFLFEYYAFLHRQHQWVDSDREVQAYFGSMNDADNVETYRRAE